MSPSACTTWLTAAALLMTCDETLVRDAALV
jgi:hypothetical protein